MEKKSNSQEKRPIENQDYEEDEFSNGSESEVFVQRSQKSNFNGLKFGTWTSQQNCRYIAFVDCFRDTFIFKQKRKNVKIFRTLAEFLKTRNAAQCRSHFQKLMKKSKRVITVIQQCKDQVGEKQYEAVLQEVKSQLKIQQFQTKLERQQSLEEPIIKKEAQQAQNETISSIPSMIPDQQMVYNYHYQNFMNPIFFGINQFPNMPYF